MKKIGSVVVIAAVLAGTHWYMLEVSAGAVARESQRLQDAPLRLGSGTTVPPNPAAMEAKRRLDRNSPTPWVVKWDKHSGLPESMSGRSSASFGSSPSEAALKFVDEYRTLFTGIRLDSGDERYGFRVNRVKERKDHVVVHFQESYLGVDVYKGGVAVHLDKEGHAIFAGGSPWIIEDMSVSPLIPAEQVVPLVRTAVLPDSLGGTTAIKLCVLPSDPPRLVYTVGGSVWIGQTFWPYNFFIDAMTGKIVSITRRFTGKGPGDVGSIPYDDDGGGTTGTDWIDTVRVLKLGPDTVRK